VDVFSPDVEPKVPAEQRPLQAGVPTAAVDPYRPMGHAMQTHAPVRLYCPAGHMDTVAVVDWEGQMKPAVQLPVQAVQYMEGAKTKAQHTPDASQTMGTHATLSVRQHPRAQARTCRGETLRGAI
jgi:hypothetical protein